MEGGGAGGIDPHCPLVPPALKLIPRSWCRKTSSKVADRILKKVPIWFRYVTSDQVRSKISCSLNFPLMHLHKYFSIILFFHAQRYLLLMYFSFWGPPIFMFQNLKKLKSSRKKLHLVHILKPYFKSTFRE